MSMYATDTIFDKDGFVETFDSVGVEESLVERVIESFNSELMSQGSVVADQIDPETIDGEAIGIETTDDEGELLGSEEIADAIRDRQREVIRNAVDRVVNDPGFPEAFTSALDSAHTDVVDAVDVDLGLREPTTDDGEMFISLERTYRSVVRELEQDPITAQLVENPTTESGRLKIGDRTTTYGFLWSFLENAEQRAPTYLLGTLVASGLAILLAERRPWTIIAAGMGVVSVAVIIVVVMYVIWGMMPLLTESRVSADLVGSVYQHALGPMTRLQITVGAIGLGVAVVGWLTRWIWPDDWVYSHYDDGTGARAVARRATSGERQTRRPARGGQGGGRRGQRQPRSNQRPVQQPQYQDGYQQPQYQEPLMPDMGPGGFGQGGSGNQGSGRQLGAGPQGGDDGGGAGWDYDSSSW